MSEKRKCVIAVHAGAGYHSPDKEKEYKSACAVACQQAMAKLKDGISALEAVSIAIQCLEDSMMTNAGTGSNLSIKGTVECDASIMDGKTLLFGGVGALSNIQNPIQVAQKLVEEQQGGILPLGRIPPCMMVGEGACTWAKEHGIQSVTSTSMKTAGSVKMFENHKRRLEKLEERKQIKRRKHQQVKEDCPSADLNNVVDDTDILGDGLEHNAGVQDTVGAVCIDASGNMASGVSSGGISLKQNGRLGPAALYGAGCWAYNWRNENKPGVAVATSGTGEHIMKTLLAKTCSDSLQREDCPIQAVLKTLQDDFLLSDYLDQSKERFGGILSIKHVKSDTGRQSVEIVWAHTTDSMCVGYMTSDSKPKITISRLKEEESAGHTVCLQGHHIPCV